MICLFTPPKSAPVWPAYIHLPRLKLLAGCEMFQRWEAGREDPDTSDLSWRLRGDTRLSSGQNLRGGGGTAGD